ncbi:MAG: aminotransferase class I/II-fold pyridoxal phosphate-dependent enzyme [Planctomycetota bacterium]|nr:aminotransferase class I/II-fold pyridoxal phosphate-dependent enzyme [Planctomycetota bacterium]
MPGPGTTSVHGPDDGERRSGPVNTPVERATTYRFENTDALVDASHAGRGFYTRYGHANFEPVEARFAALHGAEGAVLFASGMAAVAAVVQAFCRAGDRVAVMADVYGGTRALLDHMVERGELVLDVVPFDALDALEERLHGTRVFFAETPTNPSLRLVDVPRVAAACKATETLLVVDGTFAGPTQLRPLPLGADLVLESATKQLAGHSDVMGGLLAGSAEHVAALANARRLYGAVPDPETAWLIERGMKTLDVRARRQAETAGRVARWLDGHDAVLEVRYPGLEVHPQHALLERLGAGPGAMLSFRVTGGGDGARRVIDALELIANAPSLGGVESLASLPRFTSHAHLTPEERTALGVTDDLVRLSVGLEDADDLIDDLDRALRAPAT